MYSGACFGAIEAVEPGDGEPFDAVEANAVAFVAQRYGAFVAKHGVIVDVGLVARAAYDETAP